MAEIKTQNLNVSLKELKKHTKNTSDFKKYFDENSYIDDSVIPHSHPLDGDKDILIQRWINTDFNMYIKGINQWDGEKFDRVMDDYDWVEIIEKALPDEDVK